MKGYGPATFGELNAEDYDRLHDPGTTDAAVAALAALANGGRVLELAIGTGRIALPLAARGLSVHGIDASPDMIAGLRAKPGGAAVPVTIGDIADFTVEGGPFDLVVLIFNTLFNLTTLDAQVNCFKCAAAHLASNGRFVIEAFVPDVAAFRNGQSFRVREITAQSLAFDAARHDPVSQTIEYQIVRMRDGAFSLTPLPMRYAWPSELDLMARLAGLELHERWSDWTRAPFTAESRAHISVYGRPA
ncbi:MAG: methyltransferase domain-containing protein [Alphaproteobacteria bacterium]|nr:methyltransferase domain-containing protein [Alphaproteobacteria bacterium]